MRMPTTLAATFGLGAGVMYLLDPQHGAHRRARLGGAVAEMRALGDDRTHWVVAGPGGVPIEWDVITTRRAPNRAIAWRTVKGAPVEHHSVVRFQSLGPDRSRLELRMLYRPVGGAVDRPIAAVLGADPERLIDEDLERFKAQLRPAPAAVRPIRSPGTRRPAASASASAIGIEAAPVLP